MIRPRRLAAVVLSVRDLEQWVEVEARVTIGAGGIEIALNPLEDPDSATTVDTKRQACVQLFCLEVDEADLSRVEAEFPEDDDIIVLDDHPRYKSRIVEDSDGHAIELIVKK